MRNKLALTIALASFGVVTALGVGFAGAEDRRPPKRESRDAARDHPGCPPRSRRPAPTNSTTTTTAWSTPKTPTATSPADTSEEPERRRRPQLEARRAQRRRPQPEPAASRPARRSTATIGAGGGGVTTTRASATPAAAVATAAAGSAAPSATGGGVQPPPEAPTAARQFSSGGSPTAANPTTTIAPFGPAPIGVPNFVIDSFEIPPFLLPIYQACGTEYGIPWEVLASINKIETAFGTNLNVSSAGAVGWMQFLPSSWEAFGLDANGDGRKDPYNPVDAICAAAHYLKLSGGTEDLYNAILAYNHADWYVEEVLLYARAYGKLPPDLVGSLTGLTEGAHFPVAADASYADDISAREALKRAKPGTARSTATPPT